MFLFKVVSTDTIAGYLDKTIFQRLFMLQMIAIEITKAI